VGLRVWIERGERALMGKGRLELLGAIDRYRSISAAARQLGMSYRRAWELVQSINEAAGEPLVVAATGGKEGGGAQLTPLGRWAVAIFGELQDRLQRTAASALSRLVGPAQPTTLHVAAAVSLEEALGRLLTDFALREPALRVRSVFGGSDELADQILGGAPADLFLSADPKQVDRLGDAKMIGRGNRMILAENGLAAIGAAEQEIGVRKPADLARDGVAPVAIAAIGCPLGGYTSDYLEAMRLADRIIPSALRVENSRAVVAAVRAGQAKVGLVYSSDAAHAEGCRILFRVDRPRKPIRYIAAVVSRGQDETAAKRLLAFLKSEQAQRRFRECGFVTSHHK
jgi:molybdenum ABC transporter molybdate-binding protein